MLLLFGVEKGCRALQVFGDSMIVINWVTIAQRCHITILEPILEEVLNLKTHFDSVSIHHVYRECNHLVDAIPRKWCNKSKGSGRWWNKR